MKKYLSAISKGIYLTLSLQVVSSLGLTFAFLFFQENDLEFYKLFSIWWIAPLMSLPILYFLNSWPLRKRMIIGALMYPVMLLSLIFYSEASFIIYGAANGIALSLFWVPLNTVFFSKTDKSRNATDFSIYFIIGPSVAIFFPLLGALIINKFGYITLFTISLALSALPLYALSKAKFEEQPAQTFKEASRGIKGVRLAQALNAALHFFFANFIPIYLLYFISTEYGVSGALSGIAFIGLIVSVFVARFSDQKANRLKLITPLLALTSVMILVVSQIESLFMLAAMITAMIIVNSLSMPLRFAHITDNLDKNVHTWRALEFYGNIGRASAFSLTAIAIYFDVIWLAFAVFSAISAAFIIRIRT